MLALHPDELRADLQQTYGLDLDEVGVAHSLAHYATCAAQLPTTARVFVAEDEDRAWGLSETLAAAQVNALNDLLWIRANEGRKHAKGKPPQPVGPGMSHDKRDQSGDRVKASVMSVDELRRQLSRPRREVQDAD